MTDATTPRVREELRRLLDAFGGDSARWPQHRLPAMQSLLADDGVARDMLAEARRLDAALDKAAVSATGSAVARLTDRIVAVAVAERANASVADGEVGNGDRRVIAWPAPASRTGPAARTPMAPTNRSRLRIAGMLAASLAIGVFAGARDIVPASPIVSAIEARLERDSGASLAQVQSDLLTTFEEDLL